MSAYCCIKLDLFISIVVKVFLTRIKLSDFILFSGAKRDLIEIFCSKFHPLYFYFYFKIVAILTILFSTERYHHICSWVWGKSRQISVGIKRSPSLSFESYTKWIRRIITVIIIVIIIIINLFNPCSVIHLL